MLFLVIGEGLQVFPPKEMMQQFPDLLVAIIQKVQEARKQGKIEFFGGYASTEGGVIIYNADSIDEVSDFVTSLPAFPTSSWEIKPLVSADQALKQFKRLKESMAKM